MSNSLQASHDPQHRLRVSWISVAVLAVVITFADGFWITSLEGAVGAIERTQSPFTSWLSESLIVLPLFALGVLAALAVGRRWFGQQRNWVRMGATAALVVVAVTVVAVGQTTFNAVRDYRVQAEQVTKLHLLHPTAPSVDAVNADLVANGSCNSICAAQRNTLEVHVKSIGMASLLLALTNVVLVAWVLMLRGGVLWRRRPDASEAADDVPTSIALA